MLSSNMVAVEVLVYDRETGRPIPWCYVSMDAHVSFTDEHGIARFDIPLGDYTLKVRHAEYSPLTERVTVDRPKRFRVGLVRAWL